MLGGYAGKILFVDLLNRKSAVRKVPEKLYRSFIGANGLGVRILYENIKQKSDPLGPDNVLGFTTGPLTATPTPGSGRFTIVTKSPLTGAWAEANSGGTWGPDLKQAGFDAVFFTGVSPKPVYVVITEGQVEIKDASKIWGSDTYETDDLVHDQLGDKHYKVVCIGPAGESLSLISGIVNEKGRIAGRSGVGAVMGSKKLKAVAVKGSNKIVIADKEKLKTVRQKYLEQLKESGFVQRLGVYGTSGDLSFLVKIGDCPVKNWNETGLEAMPTATKLDSQNMDKYKITGYGCHACPARCGAVVQIKDGPFATKAEVHRPEYETLAALGPSLYNDNIESIIRATELCNRAGIDTMATGSAIAFAMECYEKGILTRQDTDGIELKWGNADAVVAMVENITKREGFGAVLADGAEKAAKHVGKGSEKYAMQVHGQGLAFHDPRVNPSQGTGYIVDADPGRHMSSQSTISLEKGARLGTDPALKVPRLEIYGDYESKGPMYVLGSEYYQLFTSAGLCALLLVNNSAPVAELIEAVTGWDFTWSEGLKAGRRILTLRQAFNAREGVPPSAFTLPKRLTMPASAGLAKDAKIDFNTLKAGYFAALGWDLKSGRPYPKTLIDLGLSKITAGLWADSEKT